MLKLKFYPNSRGVWVGELLCDETRLLATTHPATIAAAIFAMDEYSLCVETGVGSFEITYPFDAGEADQVGELVQDAPMGEWMRLFVIFSRFDFANPLPYDTKAEIHFRVAVYHLPPELVKVRPLGPEPKDFKRQLKNRNRFIYYPWC
ncbi:hypothetical protein G3N59_11665 [Paraburkholderia sp. Ac-20340]|uniref:hypothetical protein n=1 Tax=Paraburkholderia sp. Ac-20340 TaxID=2703888 RepID=UPI00197E203C|nr:hypothetical protein [Paraburkholderia sp. Ac-20340]MBN3854037.1 hypothetical protein [Paraburkholderia sp. Ac-20340]